MNPENYKKKRGPKPNSAVSKSKRQMHATPKTVNSPATPKLRAIYSSRTEWITKSLPKLKEK